MLDEPDSSLGARLVSLIIMVLILLSSTSFVIETMPHFKAGHCEDRCANELSKVSCEAAAGGLCSWVANPVDGISECLSFAGQARVLGWNEVDRRSGTPSAGGFVMTKAALALNLDFPISDIHQCADTPEIDSGWFDTGVVEIEPTEYDERICQDLTDDAVVYHGNVTYEGKMKDICKFKASTTGHRLHILEYICIVAFTVEYIFRMATCTQRPREDKSFCSYFWKPLNLVDLISILPFYIELLLGQNSSLAVLRILRMTRLFRVMKMGNYMHELGLFLEGYKRSRDGLILLLCMLALYLCVFGSILYLIEYPQQSVDCFDGCGHEECYASFEDGISGDVVNWDMLIDCEGSVDAEWEVFRDYDGSVPTGSFTNLQSGNLTRAYEMLASQNTTCRECCASCVHRGFTSITTTWYFILATMTTVGYGDHYPATVLGKFVTFLCMCFGIIVIALPIIVIGSAFEEVFLQEEKYKLERSMKVQLKKLKRMDQSKEQVKAMQAAIKKEKATKPNLDEAAICEMYVLSFASLIGQCGTGDFDLKQKLEVARDALDG